MTPLRRNAAITIVLVVAALLVQTAAVARHGLFMADFRAFSCGAQAIVHAQDPYLVRSLAVCESSPSPPGFFRAPASTPVPTPLPPYAYALFIPLTLLPYPLAALLWMGILLVASAVSAHALARLAGIGRADAWALLAFALVGMSVPFGEIVPLVLAALCLAALALERGAIGTAAAWCALAAIEPHVALPALCALALWCPASRVWLLLAGLVLVALSGMLVGLPAMLSYLTAVLPAHALAELPRDTQFSLSWILWRFGAGDGLALRVGSLSYLMMLVVGVTAAGALARRWGRACVIVLLPASAVLLGGAFIHIGQMAVALPFVALALRYAVRGRWALQLALILLALPFQFVGREPSALFLAAALCGWLVWRFVRADAVFALRCALALVVLDAALMFAVVEWRPPAFAPVLPVQSIDPAFPQASWATMIRLQAAENGAAWLFKLPTWLALMTMLCVTAVEVQRARVGPSTEVSTRLVFAESAGNEP
ncbi:DUF2029 domain-containing protein [bacterium]|nr:MAG: DUF2029 domain-containing protein [bacterium]